MWIEDQRSLQGALDGCLRVSESWWPHLTNDLVFPVMVDYGASIGEMAAFGNYDYYDPTVTKLRGGRRRGTREVDFHLVRFKGQDKMSPDEVREVLHKKGLRPAEILELLAFGAQYQDVQKHMKILALGSVRETFPGDPVAPELGYDKRPRTLFLFRVAVAIQSKGTRCAAVPI